MDAGGLASMTYNGYYANNGFGTPTSGYGSRGKSAHMKRLSVAPSSNMNSIHEDEIDSNPAPRTSRSHLLAGLRTAPRQGNNVPSSAPYNQQRFGQELPGFAGRTNTRIGQNVPQTATASHFQQSYNTSYGQDYQNPYCLPEQVLAPPELSMGSDNAEHMDPDIWNSLMQQNMYLLQRQQQLQQQLVNVTAAAQQFQGLNLNNGHHAPATPITPLNSMYTQQAQNGVQPIVQPTNQPGVYMVYNPLTGQQTMFYDQDHASSNSPPTMTPGLVSSSPEPDGQNKYGQRDGVTSPLGRGFNMPRTSSPPKGTPSPQQDVTPLPPPSATAFRPGHRKSMSNNLAAAAKNLSLDGVKTAESRAAGFPRTPMTGTFGPGMGRAGEHPLRQPKGPPPLEELIANPTSLHEGSKNFAARQRRRAVHDLVRAGKERSGRSGSSDLGTPNSEGEISFVISSDADSEGGSSATGSGSLSGDPTFGNFKAATAIGSERRKEAKDRPRDRTSTSSPFSPGFGNGEGAFNFGQPRDFAAAVKTEELQSPPLGNERRRSPLLVLTSAAEKRKSFIK